MEKNYKKKVQKLRSAIDEYTNTNIIIAFSGGVDSSLLLKIACEAASRKHKKVYAVTIHTELHPMNDLTIAKRVAEEAGAEHLIIKVNELQEAGINKNPENRCYLCKKYLFSKIRELAYTLNVNLILEGTNEDDLYVYRPGIKALKELGIISPLAEAKMSKKDIRKLAGEYGISVANRPSAPCLATRFPYGTELSYEEMKRVEEAEEYLKSLGFYNIRVRVHRETARIEIDSIDMDKLLRNKDGVIFKLKELGYHYVTLDLEGFRSGSMDIFI